MAEIADVVLSEVIDEDWGNDIRDRTVQRYADSAERATEHPTPSIGDLSFLEDTKDIDVWTGAKWEHIDAKVGSLQMFASGSGKTGWLLCNGAAVSRSTYANLFLEIGTTYGTGDGSTTFNLPDFRGRYPMGVAASGTGNVIGTKFGSINHTHTGPSHSHSVNPPATNTTTDGDHVHDLSPGVALITLYDEEVKIQRKTLPFAENWSMNFKSDSVGFNVVSAGVDTATNLQGDTATEGDHNHSVNIGSVTSSNSGTGATGTNNPPTLTTFVYIRT